jgi:hypothetical protein
MSAKRRIILATGILCASITQSVQAATHAVLPGASIQAKIDIAVAGDIVAIFGGTYNQDITINKAIRLVEVSGQQVTLTGNVTFTGVTNCPVFDGFTVGSAGRGISVANTTGLVFQNLDARNSSGITTSGTTHLKITNSQLSSLTPSSTTVEVTKTSLTGDINQTAGSLIVTSSTVAGNFNTQSTAIKTVAFRTIVSGDNNWRSKKNWFGYSEARSFNFVDQNEAKLVVVGNKIDRQGGEANGIYCNVSNSKIVITNNRVVRVAYPGGGDGKNGIDLRGGGNTAVIANNYCQLEWYFIGFDPGGRGDGIHVRDFTQATIINNLIVGARFGISAPFGVLALNNLYWGSPWPTHREANGVTAEGTLYTDPLFVENEAPVLQPTSPCINAGTTDPRYNNRDGTRNTIGPSGGPWIDPDGWTTENPVVISFDLTPDMVLEGVDTEVIISEGQAVSAP